MRIELVYFPGCPHVAAARAALREALARSGLPATWTERDTTHEATPPEYRRHASPTVLVDGVDVEGKPPVSGGSCAVGGGPSVERLLAALAAAAH